MIASRRYFIAASAAYLTAGCSESPVFESTVQAFKYVLAGAEDPPLTRSAVAKLPYASITAKIGKGPRTLLLLAYLEGINRHWHSGDRVALVTRHGRLVRTVGLTENLRRTRGLSADPLSGGAHEIAAPVRFSRAVDVQSRERFVLPIDSTFERVRAETITILEIDFSTVLIRERNVARLLDWEFENLYWVDSVDGFVWKSRQHLSRALPPIEIEVLKPAA